MSMLRPCVAMTRSAVRAMNLKIVHPNVGQVAHSQPVAAAIKGSEQAKMRAGIKQIGVDRILAHYFHWIV